MKDPEDVEDFKAALHDYFSGHKDDETVSFIVSNMDAMSCVLTGAAGKEVARGAAIYGEKMAQLANFRSLSDEENQQLAHRLLHSAELAPNTGGHHGLCSTTTVAEVAKVFAAERHQALLQDGIDSYESLVRIIVDPVRTPKGYVQ